MSQPQVVQKYEKGHEIVFKSAHRETRKKAYDQPHLQIHNVIGNHGFLQRYGLYNLQAKFKISQSGDKYEQEADRVAEEVMRMPEPMVQRQEENEEEEEIQRKPGSNEITPLIQRQTEEEDEEETIQAKRDTGQSGETTPQFEQSLHTLRGGGQPLSSDMREYFEPRFGVDFSGVRVHTSMQADESSAIIGARAFAIGTDIVFNRGEFVPHTQSGHRLLAHELTHIVQQSGVNTLVTKTNHDKLLRQPHLNDKLIQCAPNEPHQTGISIDYLSSISLRALMPPRIRGAIDKLELAGMGTFGPWIALALRSLTAGITYRDPKHQNHNGQEVEIVLRNQVDKKKMKIFRLRLVLDDQKNPLEQARFESDGDSGSIALNIHQPKKTEGTKEEKDQLINSLSDDELADILHHEGMHMLHYWQRKYGKEYLPFSGVSQAILGLSDVESKQTTKLIEKNLRTIFDVVNEHRRQKKVPLIPYSRAIDFAQRLTEEAMVRGETQFMDKMQERRGQARTMGIGRVQTGLSELSGPIDRATPEAYLFEFGDMLTLQDLIDLKAAGDKAADANDALKKIAIVFNGLIETHLELRYRTVEAIEMKP